MITGAVENQVSVAGAQLTGADILGAGGGGGGELGKLAHESAHLTRGGKETDRQRSIESRLITGEVTILVLELYELGGCDC